MRRSNPRETSDRDVSGFSRGFVQSTDVGPRLQEGKVGLFAGETSSGVEITQPYGTASRVHGPTDGPNGQKQHAETWISYAGGDRSQPVAQPPSDRRYKVPVELAEGERCSYAYSRDGQTVSYTHYKADGSTVHRGGAGQTTTHGTDGSITQVAKNGGTLKLDASGNIVMTPAGGGKIMMG